MALNLSTLTNSATSADVLAEVLTTADFLEPCPVLRNLARGSNKGGDAKQDVALNQPKALPLIKNPAGDLGGYLYIPDASGNYAEGPSVTIGADETWEAEVDMVITQFGNYIMPMGGGGWTSGFSLLIYDDGRVRVFSRSDVSSKSNYGVVPLNTPFNLKYGFNGSALYVELNSQSLVTTSTGSNQSASITHPLQLAQQNNLGHSGNYAIQKAKLTVGSSVVFDCDFNGSTSIRHGDTKFQAAVGGPVTLTKSGNDPATVIKKSVLRFDGASDGLLGLLNQTVSEFHYFIAFSILGSGGETSGRIFEMSSDDGAGYESTGVITGMGNGADLAYFLGGWQVAHNGMFDDANGEMLHQLKITNGSQISKINNADEDTRSLSTAISAEEFAIGMQKSGTTNAAIDLEFLALFPASITDAQADDVRNYINNRNNVFLRHDTDGYYFFDPLSLAADAPVASWNGQIVGSDNDANLTITQSTANSQPDRLAPDKDGMVVRFNDSNDHLIVPSSFVEPAAGWQVVGTSLGTFAYRVNNTAVTELNLLGNLGNASYRFAGDLYGIILLPESATGADIEAARKLLIDRGAADGVTGSNLYSAWYQRGDIVEFKSVPMPYATNIGYSFASQAALVSFPAMSFPALTYAGNAFQNNASMNDFGAIQAPLCTNFSYAWQGCSSLTSFPSGAKLGTAATGSVSFSSAWQSSGLTSFSTPLPTATAVNLAWINCTSLTSFSSELPLVTNVSQAWQTCTSLTSFNTELPSATAISYAWYNCTSLSSFNTTDIKKGSNFFSAWHSCSALTSFPSDALLGTEANGASFTQAWRQSGLTSFSTPLPTATNVYLAWYKCLSLTSFSSSLPLATNARQAWTECTSLTSFNTSLPLSSTMFSAWEKCSSLSDFSADVFANWNPAIIFSGVFNLTWDGCTSLTAQSVENILTSIDASSKYATSDGDAYANGVNTQLADAGIDIDYDGTTLSAATNSAIDSLIGKGWQVYINGVLTIPNVLTLEPAAAYSLRSFDADADPNVVRVRRSTDGALSNFKASEVSDGTLTSWVNTEYNRYTSTNFNANVDLWSSYLGSSIANVDNIAGRDDCLKYTIDNNSGYHFIHRGGLILNGFNQRISFEVYIPSTNTVLDEVQMRKANQVFTPTSGTNKTSLKDQWVTISFEFNFPVQSRFDIAANSSTSISYQGNGTDTFYVRNIQVDQLTADGQVNTWYDQGGTNDASQTLVSSMPKLVDAGTLFTESGKPAINFDGVNDQLHSNFSSEISQPSYSFLVHNFHATPTAYSGVIGSIGNEHRLILGGSLGYALQSGGGLNYSQYETNEALISYRMQASAPLLNVNGSTQSVTSGSVIGSSSLEGILIGAINENTASSGNAPINCKELIIFAGDQESNRTGIENNINDTYTIY